MDSLVNMLQRQRDLQTLSFKKDPCTMTVEERAAFIKWNQQALNAELFEMLDEVGWKEWATSRHINADAAFKEMVDAWHFFMNILLAIYGPLVEREGVESLAHAFQRAYLDKREVNATRQAEGYDGVAGKCPGCHRDLKEVTIVLSEAQLPHCGACGTRVPE